MFLSNWQKPFQYFKQTLSSFYDDLHENSDLPSLSKAKLTAEFQHYQDWCDRLKNDIDLLTQDMIDNELSHEKFKNILVEFQQHLNINVVSPIYYQQMVSALEYRLRKDSKITDIIKLAKHDLHQRLINEPELALNYFYNDVINLVTQFCTDDINEKFLFNSLNFYKKFVDKITYKKVLDEIKIVINIKKSEPQNEIEMIYHTNSVLNSAYDNLLQQLNHIFSSTSESKENTVNIDSFRNVLEKIKNTAKETVTYVQKHPETIATAITGATVLTAASYASNQTSNDFSLSFNNPNFMAPATFMLSQAVLKTQHDYAHSGTLTMLSGFASLFSIVAAQDSEATIAIDNLNGTNGFAVLSKYANSYIGASLHTAYDMNKDGISDAILGAPGCPASSAYVIEGQDGNYPATLNLTNLDGVNGFEMDSPDNDPSPYLSLDQCFGFSVTAGDFNKDGYSDVAIGDPAGYQGRGSTYVFMGQATFLAYVNVTTSGTTIIGASETPGTAIVYNEQSGTSVTSGDINGDGYADLCIGAPNANLRIGKSYIYLGRENFAPTIDLTYPQEDLITIYGNSSSNQGNFGAKMASADFNGDGYADLAVSAPFANNSYGVISVFYGDSQLPTTIYTETCSNCFHFYGYKDFQTGNLLSTVLDLNGDGIADLIIANFAIGPIYVVFGQKGGFPAGLTLENLNGQNGLVITTTYPVGIGDAGDFNGDGYNEIIIGDAMSGNWGQAFIYYGHSGSFPTTIDTSQMNATNSYIISNDYDSYLTYGSEFGTGVSTAGDMNQDGCSDVMVSNPHGYRPSTNAPSITYFVFSNCSNTNAEQKTFRSKNEQQSKIAKLMTLGFAKNQRSSIQINEVQEQQTALPGLGAK